MQPAAEKPKKVQLPDGVKVVEDPDELEVFYGDEPSAHIYALADLEAPFWEPSTWYRRGDAVVGLVRLPDSNAVTVYAVATRDELASLALVIDLLPVIQPGTLITAPSGLNDALRSHRQVVWAGPHLRYVLDDAATAVAHCSPLIEPIGRDHVDDLVALYASDPGAAFFLPHMVDSNSFVGAYHDGDLVAAAGTHVLSAAKRCAAVGSVYTRPSHRGQGLGRAVTAGVIERITDRVDLIGLNVAADNAPARAAYARLGFQAVLAYDEAQI